MESLKNGRYVYNYDNLLGHGSFGSVYKVKDTHKNKYYALKVINKPKLYQYGDYLFLALKREIQTQRKATQSNFPFFVGLYDHFEDSKNIYLILEFCERSLLDFLKKVKLSEK